MSKRKITFLLNLSLMVFIVTFMAIPLTVSVADTQAALGSQSSIKNKLLNKIIDQHKEYANYNVDITEQDFDGDGRKEYFYIFTKKEASKDDNYFVDIWYGSKEELSRVVKWQDILRNTYGSLKLAGRYYFRYDLAYATTSRTILLSTVKGKCREAFNLGGAARFTKGSNDFIVTGDSYDMEYLRKDKYTCGHTWKDYYFYADKQGIHEYGAVKISQKTFLKYQGAQDILNQLKTQYKGENTKVSFRFLKRSNGLLHINIYCDNGDCINHYYVTYRIDDKNKLTLLEASDGLYQPALNKSIAVYS